MANAGQQSQNSDNSFALLWGILLTFALMGLSWLFFHDWIATYLLRWRLLEARLIALLSSEGAYWVHKIEHLSPADAQFEDLSSMSVAIGRYLRFPISMILVGFAGCIYLGRANLRFKRYYDMQTLANLESENWPQITPALSLDLVNTPLDVGPWAMALTPFQFAKNNQLLLFENGLPSIKAYTSTQSHHNRQVTLKRVAAQHQFAVQLGPLWKGASYLSMPAKALFVIFAARGVHDKEVADTLLAQISKSATQYFNTPSQSGSSALDFSGVDELLPQYEKHPMVVRVIHQHAYVLGVMASMLILARESGVLASAEFLWLKPCDRILWFMLNCIGRRTAYAEVAGPFAHWTAERAVGCRLKSPMIDAAMDALELALREVQLPQDSTE